MLDKNAESFLSKYQQPSLENRDPVEGIPLENVALQSARRDLPVAGTSFGIQSAGRSEFQIDDAGRP